MLTVFRPRATEHYSLRACLLDSLKDGAVRSAWAQAGLKSAPQFHSVRLTATRLRRFRRFGLVAAMSADLGLAECSLL